MATDAFRPIAAATVNIDVSSSSQRVIVANANDNIQVRVANDGTATVWLNWGDVTVTAATTTGYPLAAGAIEVVTLKASGLLYMAAIAAGSTGKVYATPGFGF